MRIGVWGWSPPAPVWVDPPPLFAEDPPRGVPEPAPVDLPQASAWGRVVLLKSSDPELFDVKAHYQLGWSLPDDSEPPPPPGSFVDRNCTSWAMTSVM